MSYFCECLKGPLSPLLELLKFWTILKYPKILCGQNYVCLGQH